jgi:hypothetical protein
MRGSKLNEKPGIGSHERSAVIEPNLTLYETATGNWWLPDARGDIVANAMKEGAVFGEAGSNRHR